VVRFATAVLATVGLVLCGVTCASAQSSSADLADLSLAELVAVEVVPDDQDVARWHADYNYVRVVFDGYRDGTTDVSLDSLRGPAGGTTFPVLPTRIVQEAHVFQIGYDLPARTSVAFSVPYIRQSTDHVSVVPGYAAFNIMSDGIGDVSATFSHRIMQRQRRYLSWTIGASLPSGSIDKEGDTPRNTGQPVEQLPYTMQLGSGTYDLILGAAYAAGAGSAERPFAYSAQMFGKIRNGRNARDYSLGNIMVASLDASVRPAPWVEPLVGVRMQFWEDIEGADTSLQLAPGVYPAPVTNPELFGGRKVNLLAGARFILPESLGGQRVSVTGSWPIHQSLNGPQPKETWRVDVGWNMDF
jgi:hypothetical protein